MSQESSQEDRTGEGGASAQSHVCYLCVGSVTSCLKIPTFFTSFQEKCKHRERWPWDPQNWLSGGTFLGLGALGSQLRL